MAYEAEALLTMRQMAEKERISLEFNFYQAEVLRRFPDGIASLDPSLVYQTPEYSSFFPGDLRLN